MIKNFFDDLKNFNNKKLQEKLLLVADMSITLTGIIGCVAVTSRDVRDELTVRVMEDSKDFYLVNKVEDILLTLEMLSDYAQQLYWCLSDGFPIDDFDLVNEYCSKKQAEKEQISESASAETTESRAKLWRIINQS